MKNATLAMILSIQPLFGNFGDTDETLRTRFQTEIGGSDPNRKKRKRKVRVWGRSLFAFRKNPIGKMRRKRSIVSKYPINRMQKN